MRPLLLICLLLSACGPWTWTLTVETELGVDEYVQGVKDELEGSKSWSVEVVDEGPGPTVLRFETLPTRPRTRHERQGVLWMEVQRMGSITTVHLTDRGENGPFRAMVLETGSWSWAEFLPSE